MLPGEGVAGWIRRQVPIRMQLFVVAGAVVSAALVVVSAPLTGYAFDLVLGHSGAEGWLVAAAVLLASQVLRAIVVAFRQGASIRLGSALERDLRAALIDRLIGGSGRAIAREQALGILVGDARALRFLAYPGLDLVISSVAVLAATVVTSAVYGPIALVAPMVYAVGYTFIIVGYVRSVTVSAGGLRGSAADLTAVLEETLDGLEAVRDSNLSDQIWARVNAACVAHRDLSVRQGWVERRAPLFLLLGFCQAIGFAVAITGLRSGTFGIGDVVSYVGLLMMLGVPTFSAYAGYPRVASGLAAAKRIRDSLSPGAGQELTRPDHVDCADGNHLAPSGVLAFSGVEFGYPLTGPIIRHADFSLPVRGLTVIVGAVGAGKSSLARLVAGALQPTSGMITINGVAVRAWDQADRAAWVAMIEDDPALFSVSIEDNIRLGRDHLTAEQVADAVRRSCADRFIDSLPDGYATRIGAGGTQLSGGERQRLALARALLSSVPVLVLDDPLSALDADTAGLLEKELLELAGSRSLVIVTDRPAMLNAATLVLHVGPMAVTARLRGTSDV